MGPAKQTKKNSAGGINRGEKKELFASFPSCFFFPCDQWQQVTNDNKCFFLRQARFACPNDCVEKKKKQFTDQMQAKSSENSTKKKQHCCPQLKKKHLSISFLRQGCFFAQLIGCNKKTVDSVNAKKKMQQVRVKKLFHYWPFTIERKTRLFFFCLSINGL